MFGCVWQLGIPPNDRINGENDDKPMDLRVIHFYVQGTYFADVDDYRLFRSYYQYIECHY